MDFQARVIQFIGETTGTSKAGNPWKKKEWVVETFGQYPRKIKVQCFGERSDSINLEPGKDYTLYVDLESREFNGRWYTDVSVYRVEEYNGHSQNFNQGSQGGFQSTPQNFGGTQYPTQADAFGGAQPFTPSPDESDEDLPF